MRVYEYVNVNACVHLHVNFHVFVCLCVGAYAGVCGCVYVCMCCLFTEYSALPPLA